MINAIQLGPLLLPFTLLLVFASAGTALAVGRWFSRASAAGVEQTLWWALLAGAVAARLAFVFEYRSLYLDSPLAIVNLRDGGWDASFGLLGAWGYALYRARNAPALRRPLRWALGVGSAVFIIGTAALALRPGTGQTLPELAFTSLDGSTVQLSAFNGKPTVVNLWATWCPPCVREMPVLHEAQARHGDVNFVFLNQGEDAAQVSRWLGAQRLTLRNVLLDPRREASAAFKTKGYPTTLLFNARGELVSMRLGELSAPTLDAKLQALRR